MYYLSLSGPIYIELYMYVPLEFTLRGLHMFAEIALDCTSKDEDMLVSDINAPLMIKEKTKDAVASSSKMGGGGVILYRSLSHLLYPNHIHSTPIVTCLCMI